MDDTVHANSQANPYAPPQAELAPPPRWSGTAGQMRVIAQFQRGLLLCVLVYFAFLPFEFAAFAFLVGRQQAGTIRVTPRLSAEVLGVAASMILVLNVALLIPAAYFLFRLSARLYSTAAAILAMFLVLVPYFGLFVVLFINTTATHRLRGAGCRVGLLGAKLSQFDREPPG